MPVKVTLFTIALGLNWSHHCELMEISLVSDFAEPHNGSLNEHISLLSLPLCSSSILAILFPHVFLPFPFFSSPHSLYILIYLHSEGVGLWPCFGKEDNISLVLSIIYYMFTFIS